MKANHKLIKLSLLFCLFSSTTFAQADWEMDYLKNLEENRTQGKTSFYNVVSGSAYIFTLGTPLSYLITGAIKKDKTLKKRALYITESVGIATAIAFTTKELVKRERPAIQDLTFHSENNATNYSFPSGHTSAAFSLATSMSIINHKWFVVVPSFAWATMVGYSRMYLGVHYPSDVIVGALVGTGSAWLSYRLNKWMHPKADKVKNAPAM